MEYFGGALDVVVDGGLGNSDSAVTVYPFGPVEISSRPALHNNATADAERRPNWPAPCYSACTIATACCIT